MNRTATYLLSLPERALRSATALAGGLVREIGEVTIPATVRRSQLYQNLVEATLRFLIERVGDIKGVYPGEETLTEDFLLRRSVGNGIELIGILAFRASPVWVLAALADVTGAGRYLIREISGTLKEEGLLDKDREFDTVDQMLDGLEASAGRLATNINTPPLDVQSLREEWRNMRGDLARIPPKNLPSLDSLSEVWTNIRNVARSQHRSAFEVSSVMALSAIGSIPQKARWLSSSARVAAGKAGSVLAGVLLDHYRTTLTEIRKRGYIKYAVQQYRPYLFGAASLFSPQKRVLTERLIERPSKK